MAATAKEMVELWRSRWRALVSQDIADMYTEDGIHMSSVVNERMGISSATLNSRDAIKLYADEAVKRLTSFDAEIINIFATETAHGGTATVEYWRILNGNTENKSRVCEILEWKGDKITSCRVYHF